MWDYLEAIMRKMDFEKKLITPKMKCVSKVRYFVFVNGNPKDVIYLARELWQDDLLFPYDLFILCAEGLSSLINQVENRDNQSRSNGSWGS